MAAVSLSTMPMPWASGDGKKERRSRRNQDFAPERKSYRKGSKSSEGAFDKYKGGKSSKGGKKKNRW